MKFVLRLVVVCYCCCCCCCVLIICRNTPVLSPRCQLESDHRTAYSKRIVVFGFPVSALRFRDFGVIDINEWWTHPRFILVVQNIYTSQSCPNDSEAMRRNRSLLMLHYWETTRKTIENPPPKRHRTTTTTKSMKTRSRRQQQHPCPHQLQKCNHHHKKSSQTCPRIPLLIVSRPTWKGYYV